MKRVKAPPPKRLEKVTCQECGKVFTPKQFYQRYCSTNCRVTAYWRRRLAGAA